MRLLIPVITLGTLTVGTIVGWRSERHPTSLRMYLLRFSLVCCSLSALLAFVFFSCEFCLFGLHRTSAQLAGGDFQLLKLMIRLSSVGFITSILTAIGGIAAPREVAGRWCLGLGVSMALIWLVMNLGYAELLMVRTQHP